jgi:hypothetical protein
MGAAGLLWFNAGSGGDGRSVSGSMDVKSESTAQGRIVDATDLGPQTIDVSAYPVAQQENYRLFSAKCTPCHSLGRSINSPIVDASTWTRYVKRMHGKNQARRGGPLLSGEEAKKVLSFLVYDSRERKIKRGEEFRHFQEELRLRYMRWVSDQRRTQKEDLTRSAVRESAPYVGY